MMLQEKFYGMHVAHSDGSQSFDYEELIEKLGADKIQSSEFSVVETADSITFTGYGRGHGVGLCLYSANIMASYGKDAPEILQEFSRMQSCQLQTHFQEPFGS